MPYAENFTQFDSVQYDSMINGQWIYLKDFVASLQRDINFAAKKFPPYNLKPLQTVARLK